VQAGNNHGDKTASQKPVSDHLSGVPRIHDTGGGLNGIPNQSKTANSVREVWTYFLIFRRLGHSPEIPVSTA
jgi:hypothetical protein